MANAIRESEREVKDLLELKKTDHDTKLPADIVEIWLKYRQTPTAFAAIRIKRWLGTMSTDPIQLHGFADASEKGYPAAVYVRVVQANGIIQCNLVTAKARIAPQKLLTIPRMELCAAVLLAQLLTVVKGALKRPTSEYAWSESTIAALKKKTEAEEQAASIDIVDEALDYEIDLIGSDVESVI